MKRLVLVALVMVALASSLAAQTGPSGELPKQSFQLTGLAGGATVINACPLDFSYGFGLRWTKYLQPNVGLALAAGYNHQGGRLDVDCFDLQLQGVTGRSFFVAGGLYAGINLSFVPWDGWDVISDADFGTAFDVGYTVPQLPGLTIGFRINSGLVDIFPEDIQNTGRINQLNIQFGPWLGYRLF